MNRGTPILGNLHIMVAIGYHVPPAATVSRRENISTVTHKLAKNESLSGKKQNISALKCVNCMGMRGVCMVL